MDSCIERLTASSIGTSCASQGGQNEVHKFMDCSPRIVPTLTLYAERQHRPSFSLPYPRIWREVNHGYRSIKTQGIGRPRHYLPELSL